ncbi:ATP-binding protein [Lentzea guizhouensis]|uniref:ATP-binding protein n=1 Tax=Lentzea guizhouensis TaxID=1586287 RepID=UPI003AAD5331
MEVAAAGAHHLLLTGPPGTGKTMLAERLAGLLPPLTREDALAVTAVHSVAGVLSSAAPLVASPPFVTLHHTTSIAALVGGGSGLAKPGAASRAHRGVLFLDEACEWGQKSIESLRTALEDGEIRIARRDGTARYPARFQLVLATNPCPCAPPKEIDCCCTPAVRRRYQSRLSGPLLDRVDLRVRMRPMTAMSNADATPPEPTATVRSRVLAARLRAAARWSSHGHPWQTNADVPGPALRREFPSPHASSTEPGHRRLTAEAPLPPRLDPRRPGRIPRPTHPRSRRPPSATAPNPTARTPPPRPHRPGLRASVPRRQARPTSPAHGPALHPRSRPAHRPPDQPRTDEPPAHALAALIRRRSWPTAWPPSRRHHRLAASQTAGRGAFEPRLCARPTERGARPSPVGAPLSTHPSDRSFFSRRPLSPAPALSAPAPQAAGRGAFEPRLRVRPPGGAPARPRQAPRSPPARAALHHLPSEPIPASFPPCRLALPHLVLHPPDLSVRPSPRVSRPRFPHPRFA